MGYYLHDKTPFDFILKYPQFFYKLINVYVHLLSLLITLGNKKMFIKTFSMNLTILKAFKNCFNSIGSNLCIGMVKEFFWVH